MPLLDRLQDGFARVFPAKVEQASQPLSGGIASGHIPFGDDMIVPKTAIIFHTSQVFFSFLAMACFASVAGFQAKWGVGPSGLTGFALFIAISGMLLSLFMLLIPVIYEKYDRFPKLARTLKEVRVGLVLFGAGTFLTLLIAFITTISAFTQPGCKDANRDPHAKEKGAEFRKGLPGWCSTKRAGAIFFWLAFVFWAASLVFFVRDWRNGNLKSGPPKPRDPPFTHPPSIHTADDEDDGQGDEESTYQQIPAPRLGEPFSPAFGNDNGVSSPTTNYNSNAASSPFADPRASAVSAGRPSMDAYGAFSDPAPSGFGAGGPGPAGYSPGGGNGGGGDAPRISRTMQYADPYAAVRASIAGGASAPGSSPHSPTSQAPPSYDGYQGYR